MILLKKYDIVSFWQTLTFARIINAFKIITSYYLTRILRRNLHWGSPLSISIEPINTCNLSCIECPTGMGILTRKVGSMHIEKYKLLIDEIHKKTPYLTLYFQGEPFMNKNIFEFIRYASEKNIYVATSTNGHFFNSENIRKVVNSGLRRLIISIDGTTQEVYERYRKGGNLDLVLSGIKNLIKYKKENKSKAPLIILQFLVLRHNENQIEEMKKLARELQVDKLTFKTAQIYDNENAEEIVPSTNKFSRYKKDKSGNYKLKNKLYNHCWRSWQGCVITQEGNLVPCCFDKNANYSFGNVFENSFEQIWKSEGLKKFRQSILQNRKNIDICTNCTEGTNIWI